VLILTQNESLRDIYGYEGLYVVDRTGNIFSMVRGRCLLKSWGNGSGYLKVNLYKNGICKKHYIHRLVAKAFIPNPNNLPEVNHKDGNKYNNSVDNLEWCSRQENIEHSFNTHLQQRAYPVEIITPSSVHYNFRSMKQASQIIFGNLHTIKTLYAKYQKADFLYDGYRIKVGDVACQ
jgi:hypothetical protein